LVVETEVLGENLSQCRFVHHKPHMLPGHEPGRRGWKPATNRLSCGTALAYFRKVGLCDLHAVCVSVNILLITFESLN
jgi:hypothetical protein